ncbi:MAG: phosphopyruvate hydratase [Acidobacteria bacterium]|nr:phosphopyruvate hydratase [Acidobacteriota bacterium]
MNTDKTAIRIAAVDAWEILDSRGNPTVAASCALRNGIRVQAHAPSGASTGTHEAVELRDRDPRRYCGKGVLRAVANVRERIAPAVAGFQVEDQAGVEGAMLALDGTADKSNLGANAILAVSCAVARAAAVARGIPLWRYLAGGRAAKQPLPMTNILSGGLHAGHNMEFQDFLVMPQGIDGYPAQLEAIVAIHRQTRMLLEEAGCVLTGVADEGGWGPHLESNERALAILTAAIERAGYAPGDEVSIALDVAASHFYQDDAYHLRSEKRVLSNAEMVDLLADWAGRYPVRSIEDGLHEDDWAGWKILTDRLGASQQLVGDDFFTTNLARVDRGIREGCANAVLVKMNQIGTLTETFAVIDRAREAGYRAVISARSGETEDSFLADLATASGAGQIKIGSITRSERLAKYNRLLEIDRELQGHA